MKGQYALTHDRLTTLLEYDPETGAFTWKVDRRNGVKAGDLAGSVNSDGYTVVVIDRRTYKAARLAMFYVSGQWPQGSADHINGNRQDDRIANLRDVSTSVNAQNQRAAKRSNTSGFLGVAVRPGSRYRALIFINGKSQNLGAFDTPEQAHNAYLQAKRSLHEGCSL